MNRTIQKLFTEACYHGQFEPETVPDEVVEKFTELIVRECASQAALWTPTDEQGAEEQEKYILNHFGFKE